MDSKLVLHVLCSGNYSGAEKIALQLIDNYPKEFNGVYFAQNGIINSVEGVHHARMVLVEKVTFFELLKVVNTLQPDVIHAHDFRASIYSSLLPKKIKLISHIHQNPAWFFTINLQTFIFYLSCLRFRNIVFVGDWYLKNLFFSRVFGYKSSTIENCVSVEEIDKKTALITGEVIEKFDVLFVGRLSDEKNPLKFIILADAILKKRPATTFKIVGEGALRDQCSELIEKFGISHAVKMIGFSENPYAYMAAAKVLVNTSHYEGFGLVAVEALLLSTPCLSSGAGGLSSIFSSNLQSICQSDDDYVQKCLEILEDEKNGHKFLVSKNIIIEKFCNIGSWVNKFVSLYR